MIVLIYLEPTPYIITLLRKLKDINTGILKVIFLGENLTQKWNIEIQKSLGDEGIYIGASWLSLWKLIRHNNVTILHLSGWGHPLLIYCLLIAYIHNVPVTVESDSFETGHKRFLKRIIKKVFYPFLFKIPARFLSGGSRQAKYLKYYGVTDNRIQIAQMTVDTKAMTSYITGMNDNYKSDVRAGYGLPEEALVFLYVGRLEPHKGLHELVSAFQMLCIKDIDTPYLLLAGDGSMRDEIVDITLQNKYLKYAGRLSGPSLMDAYAVSDIFVLASRFEPWGLVINEAMAAGLPVIVTDNVGCIDDLVFHGKTGLVISTGDVDKLAAAMNNLGSDSGQRVTMSRNALELIRGWSIEDEAKIVTHTWKSILEVS